MDKPKKKLILGIDAHNIRAGGGITHLAEILSVAVPLNYGFEKVIVWSGKKTLSKLPQREWLTHQSHPYLDKWLLYRLIWFFFIRKKNLIKEKCDILFVPGGSDFSSFHPLVTMSQNLLPFEPTEIKRYGLGLKYLKFILLKYTQAVTFRKADGIIFLTPYAEQSVLREIGNIKGKRKVVPHGINPKFFMPPSKKKFRLPDSFSKSSPCKLIYVSIIEIYKHQWHVVKAVEYLRNEGYHISLELVGPPGPGSSLLNKAIADLNGDISWLNYMGAVPYDLIQELYNQADIGIFASSCETFGQIVSEGMAASLPMTCSSLSSMRDILGPFAVYFNPEEPLEIAEAIKTLVESSSLRKKNAELAYEVAEKYTWKVSADSSFEFFREVYDLYKTQNYV